MIVVFSHVLALTQLPTLQGLSLFNADFAVKEFFAISGFLVTKSYLSSNSLKEFFEKRARRIYPAYFSVILMCLFFGAIFTDFDTIAFFKHLDTLKYVLSNLVFLNFIQPSLPEVFNSNPLKQMDGALWTIKVELCLYACVPLIVAGFNRWGSLKTTAVLVLLSCAWIIILTSVFANGLGAEIARQFPGQLSYFALGAFFATDPKTSDRIVTILISSVLLFMIFKASALRVLIEPFLYASLVIYLATKAFRNLHIGRWGDLSYGVYLIHFPIIQSLIHLRVFSYNPYLGLFLTIVITLILAWLSWHFVEKRFLKRSSYYVLSMKT